MAEESRFQFTLRGLLGYCTLAALAMSALRLGYVELHGYPGLICVTVGFSISIALVAIPIGLAIRGKRGAGRGATIGAILTAVLILVSFPMDIGWSGHFRLTVHLQSTASSTITQVDYLGVASLAEGNRIAQNPQSSDRLFQPARDFDGKRFTAHIFCSGNAIGIIGYETNYFAYSFMVVRIHYRSGEQKYIVTEIPYSRGREGSMTLVMP